MHESRAVSCIPVVLVEFNVEDELDCVESGHLGVNGVQGIDWHIDILENHMRDCWSSSGSFCIVLILEMIVFDVQVIAIRGMRRVHEGSSSTHSHQAHCYQPSSKSLIYIVTARI